MIHSEDIHNEFNNDNSNDMISIDDIEWMRELQQKVKIEPTVNRIESLYREKQLTSLSEKVINIAKFHKEYYTSIFLLFQITKGIKNSDLIRPLLISFLKNSKQYNERQIEFNLDNFDYFNFFSSNDSFAIDDLTFSTIPTICDFFLTEEGITKYFYFLDKTKDAIKDFEKQKQLEVFKSLSRSVFFSPPFLKFIFFVFSPIIDQITKNVNNVNWLKEEFYKIFFGHIIPNKKYIPPYISQILKHDYGKDNNFNSQILHGFFEIFFSNHIIFNILLDQDFLRTKDENVLRTLKTFFNYENQEDFFVILKDILTDSEESIVPILRNFEFKYFSFKIFVFSSIDIPILNKNVPFTIESNFDNYVYFETEIKEEESSKSQYQVNDFEDAFITILKNSDIIPYIEGIENMKLLEFIKEYLVEKGPIESYQKRIQCYELIKNYNISNFLSKLKNIKPSFDKIIPSLSELNYVLHSIPKYESYPNSILEEMKELFIYYSLGYLGIEIENLKQNQFRIEENNVTIPNKEFYRILFKIKSLRYSFKEFQHKFENDDRTIHNYIFNNKDKLINKAMENFKGDINIFNKSVNKIENEMDFLQSFVIGAFQECKPYLKFKKLYIFFEKVRIDYIEPFSPKNKLSQEEIIPIMEAIILKLNVCGTVSNYMFINNIREDNDFIAFFNNDKQVKEKIDMVVIPYLHIAINSYFKEGNRLSPNVVF